MDFQGIRKARKSAGITQGELAHVLGINRATLSKYESGVIEPSISQLLSIASALNTSLPELLGFEYGRDISFSVNMSPELVQSLRFPENIRKITTSNPELMLKIISEFSQQSSTKERLNIAFEKLNDDGQQEAVKRMEELTEIPRYRRQEPQEPPPVPPEGKDTTPPVDGSERPTEREWDRYGEDRCGGRRNK